MKNFRLILGLFSLFGCSTNALHSPASFKNITLPDVQQFAIGKSTSLQLREVLGQPNEVSSTLFQNEDVWFYNASLNGETVNRASFTVRKKDQIIVGAVWIPFKSDSLSTERAVLSYFKELKFKTQKAAAISKDYRVDDLEYNDEGSGISFSAIRPSGTVAAISFGSRQETRVPAVAPRLSK